MDRPRTVGLAALAWVAVAAAACERSTRPPAPAAPIPITTAVARPARPTHETSVPGILSARRDATLAFQVAGQVERVAIDEGDRVAAGDALAVLDQTEIRARFEQAAAAHELAASETRRQAELLERGAITISRYEEISAELRQKRATLEIARYQLDHATLVAPFGGRIARRLVEPGETVRAGAQAVVLVDYEPVIEAEVSVPEREISGIAPDARAEVELIARPDHRFPGRVVRRGVLADASTGTYTVTIEVENPAGTLLPGMSVRAFLPHTSPFTAGTTRDGRPERAGAAAATPADGYHHRAVIPADALVDASRDRGYVFLLEGDVARRVAVGVERVGSEGVVVRSAFPVGETVVVGGAHYLRDGDRVLLPEARASQASARSPE